MRRPSNVLLLLPLLLLAGCPLGGADPAEGLTLRREAEGKAVGGACRHAGRAIEDCFGLNKRADKSALFAGWREMNDCMRENKIEAVAPVAPLVPAPTEVAAKSEDPALAEPATRPPTKPGKAKKQDS